MDKTFMQEKVSEVSFLTINAQNISTKSTIRNPQSQIPNIFFILE
jgi:hypothetical protein